MRSRFLSLPACLVAALLVPAAAAANYAHVVTRGESLASVAAADGLSVSQLAAANGLATTSQLITGATLQIPPQGGPSSVTAGPVATPGTGDEEIGEAPDGDESTAAGTATSAVLTSTSGGYLVRPGDTLSGIAAANGLSVDQLAAQNGLRPTSVLLSGTTLSLGAATATATPVATTSPVGASAPATGGAQPTAHMVSPGDVGLIAAAQGVSPSLAEAIGYQESGFNNGLVSRTGATGVMQIEPGTWKYIGQNLATPPPLSPYSAQDNIRGGVLLLHSLLDQTGGDPALAAAGYYQGLDSVRRHGMYADTRRYVNDVMALRSRFGGP
ncbi:MAG: LysM peptidoglycan-binding domain-containing protein [Solirubrobacteraceae bacterium]